MEIPSEVITEFFTLNRSQKFNIIVLIFSTIISGFILVLGVKPELLNDLSSFKISLLSIAIITPIYLFNQILSIFLIPKTSKLGLKKLLSFAKLPEEHDDSVDKFSRELTNDIASKAIYNSPARQLAEISTIISSYFAAFLGWQFNFGLLTIYIILTLSSVLVMFLIYKFLSAMISVLEPRHLKPIVEKLKKDEEFKSHIKKQLDSIKSIIEEKKKKH